MKRFPHQRILITGAGSGLGRALALEFARRGWRVALAEIDPERSRESAGAVREAGGRALEIPCDVSRPESMEQAARTVSEEWDGLDVLVNNAGVAAAGYFEKIPLEDWERLLAVNLKSVIYGCRAFIPIFKRQQSGHIVNVASCAGIASWPEMASYNLTKAGVISLSETLRVELAAHRIGVTVVCPGFFHSGLMTGFTSPDERQRTMAEALFSHSRVTSAGVARAVVRAIRRRRRYLLTPPAMQALWWLKRISPGLYSGLLSAFYHSTLFQRAFLARAEKRPRPPGRPEA